MIIWTLFYKLCTLIYKCGFLKYKKNMWVNFYKYTFNIFLAIVVRKGSKYKF